MDGNDNNYNEEVYEIIRSALNDTALFTTDSEFTRKHLERCKKLYSRDYKYIVVDNSNGRLCSSYPNQLIVPIEQKKESGKGGMADNEDEENTNFGENDYIQLLSKGRFARTRGRFPVPVFQVFGKNICRSSTLARSAEIYGRCSLNYIYPLNLNAAINENESSQQQVQFKTNESVSNIELAPATNGNNAVTNKDWMIDKMRKTDIELLKFLKVQIICDLMVENRKLKYGMHVTSSEKVDSNRRYDDFHLVCVPYPGCEFFADYSNNNYDGKDLCFDWNQQFIDADLQIPDKISKVFEFNWTNYVSWDLITLTQNYVKLMLSCIKSPDANGFLVHCISGWDRTPLFVSILRISLWADNLIHQSLSVDEMLYLTLVYDWLLFSHQFADRIKKKEEILHFCFEFLQHITSVKYSLIPDDSVEENESDSDHDSGQKTPVRCESTTSDSEQMFQLDSLSESRLDNSSSNHSSSDSNIPVDFTSQRLKLYAFGSNSSSKNHAKNASNDDLKLKENGNESAQHSNGTSSSYRIDELVTTSFNSDNTCESGSNDTKVEDSPPIISLTDYSPSADRRPHNTATGMSSSVKIVRDKNSHEKISLLSTSLEMTRRKNGFDLMNRDEHNGASHNDNSDELACRLSSALSVDTISNNADTGRSSSDPILVPGATKRMQHKALSAECLGERHNNSCGVASSKEDGSSCYSNQGGNSMGQPGSSWQVISSLKNQYNNGTSCLPTNEFSPGSFGILESGSLVMRRVRKNSSLASSEPSLLNGDFATNITAVGRCDAPQPTAARTTNGVESTKQFKLLKRRKERLDDLRKLFLVTYNTAIGDTRQEQQQGSILRSIFSTIINRS